MQSEVMFTGIGGQGIQLASKTLALAATMEGRQAMLLGSYGGAMRGGQTDASVVVADSNLRSLPILPSAWSAVVMHPDFWPNTSAKIRNGGVIVANADLVTDDLGRDDCQTYLIAATGTAEELGASMSASMVLLSAYATITGMVGTDSLVAAMKQLVPPYRVEHLTSNEAALRAGSEIAPKLAAPMWESKATVS